MKDELAAWQTRLEEAVGSGSPEQPRGIVWSMSWEQALDFARDLTKARARLMNYSEGSRRGGVAGGKARAAALSPARRSEIAQQAAYARWGTK